MNFQLIHNYFVIQVKIPSLFYTAVCCEQNSMEQSYGFGFYGWNKGDPKAKLLSLDDLLNIVNHDPKDITIKEFFPGVKQCQNKNTNAGKEAIQTMYASLVKLQNFRYEEETEEIKFPEFKIKFDLDDKKKVTKIIIDSL